MLLEWSIFDEKWRRSRKILENNCDIDGLDGKMRVFISSEINMRGAVLNVQCCWNGRFLLRIDVANRNVVKKKSMFFMNSDAFWWESRGNFCKIDILSSLNHNSSSKLWISVENGPTKRNCRKKRLGFRWILIGTARDFHYECAREVKLLEWTIFAWILRRRQWKFRTQIRYMLWDIFVSLAKVLTNLKTCMQGSNLVKPD